MEQGNNCNYNYQCTGWRYMLYCKCEQCTIRI